MSTNGGRSVDSAGRLMDGDGWAEKYRGWAKLGVDEMMRRRRRRGRGRGDRRFGSAWWRRRDWDGMGWGWGWVGSGSPQVEWCRVDPGRVVCACVCACGWVRVCTREEDLVRLAQNRESRIAIDLGVWPGLVCPLRLGPELSPAPVPECGNGRTGGPASRIASKWAAKRAARDGSQREQALVVLSLPSCRSLLFGSWAWLPWPAAVRGQHGQPRQCQCQTVTILGTECPRPRPLPPAELTGCAVLQQSS